MPGSGSAGAAGVHEVRVTLRWVRREAAEKNTSVSKLIGRMLEDEMRRTDEYWKAYEHWKKIKPVPGVDASKRAKREEIYDRH